MLVSLLCVGFQSAFKLPSSLSYGCFLISSFDCFLPTTCTSQSMSLLAYTALTMWTSHQRKHLCKCDTRIKEEGVCGWMGEEAAIGGGTSWVIMLVLYWALLSGQNRWLVKHSYTASQHSHIVLVVPNIFCPLHSSPASLHRVMLDSECSVPVTASLLEEMHAAIACSYCISLLAVCLSQPCCQNLGVEVFTSLVIGECPGTSVMTWQMMQARTY